jgi:hypothetical protein
VLEEFGSHALTLDHVGAYLAEFYDGEPAAAACLDEPRLDSDTPEERKLARVLRAYEKALSPRELDLLVRFCLFRTGATTEVLHSVFSLTDAPELCGNLVGCAEAEFYRIATRLARLHLLLPEPIGGYTAHPAVRDHFYRIFADAAAAHRIVGEKLRSDCGLDLAEEWERIRFEIHGLISDQQGFRHHCDRFGFEIRSYNYLGLSERLREFFSLHGQRLSLACAGQIRGCIQSLEAGVRDFQLPDLELESSRVTLSLRPGAAKPEAPVLLDALEEVIYHTVRAGNEKDAYELYSSRLGGREHLGKVIGEFARGVRILRYFPACPNDLDLAWYLRGVGDVLASFDLLSKTRPIWSSAILCLQGFLPRVLRDKVGWEHFRVIAAFLMGRPDAFDPAFDLGWGEALVNADLPLMRGQLARARAVAASDLKNFGNGTTHVPEQVRTRLILAEIERREGRTEMARAGLEGEAPWIFRSGSAEHLCLYHLIRSRVLTDQGHYEAADSESREGLFLTRQCGLGLAHVDFLNLRSRIALARARSMLNQNSPQREAFLEAATRSALGALHGIQTEDGAPASQPDMPLGDLVAFGAQHPECQYAWGAADALALLGETLAEQRHPDLAQDALRRAGDLQSTLQHPDLARTEELLSRLGPWE